MAPSTSSPAPGPRVALITGATGGLGTAVLGAFLDRGCAVAATYRKDFEQGALTSAAASRPLLPLKADVTSTADMEAAVAATITRFGRLDYLINLVGAWAGGSPVWETSGDAWDRTIAVNLRSAFAASRAAIPHMLTQRYGRIVSVSSRTALQPSPGAAAYAVSKAGVITLTETLALELREHDADVTANCILPSVIDTPANRAAMPKADPARWVRPEQLAAIIAWLTSDDAAPISGAAIPIYGRA
ncbi:MAG TPA: SDR family NAD(P)-dependent oxidoreductase [Chloroflexota bacterium]|nr:SDR family NAD(P)-dependent oxidoreductase [Chloroflexota bacterium]